MTRDDDAARYQQAATLALDQLAWCVTYFRSIRKTRLADQVARNRAAISRRLQDQPTPTGSRQSR
jgi:hypothetical protein